MKHSLYLTFATFLIKADLRREERLWRARVRRTAYDLPVHSAHLMRDIGLDMDGRALVTKSADPAKQAGRKTERIRRRLILKIPT